MFIQKRNTIAAGTTNDNVIAGDQFEFAPTRSIVEFGIVASATGLTCDILIGPRAVVTRMPLPVQRAANQFAIYPDEYPARGGAFQSERIIVRIANPTGGGVDAFTTVKYNPT